MHAPQLCASVLLWVVLSCLHPVQGRDLKVAAFNIQVFGETKAKKENVMEILRKIVTRYDVILVQEIREKKMTAITELMRRIASPPSMSPAPPRMEYIISKRLGRSASKEQYALIYNWHRLKKMAIYQYEDTNDYFEREPYCVIFKSTDTDLEKFGIVGIHVKPSDAVNEINNLTLVYEQMVAKYNIKDVIMMGDLNADCAYVRKSDWPSVTLRSNQTFTWLLDDTQDTTVKGSNCAYDRFVIAGDQLKAAVVQDSARVFKFDIEYGVNETTDPKAEDVSDHYPIELKIKGKASGPMSSATGLQSSWFCYITAIIMLARCATKAN